MYDLGGMVPGILEPLAERTNKRDRLLRDVSGYRRQRSELEARLENYQGFDVAACGTSLSELHSKRAALSATSQHLAEVVARIERELHSKATIAVIPLNVFKYFSSDQVELRAQISTLNARKSKLLEDRNGHDALLSATDQAISDLTGQLAAYQAFDAGDAQSQIQALDESISSTKKHIDALNDEIGAIEQRCGKQIEAFETATANILALESDIAAAKIMDEDLSSADNGYERAMVHQDCERRFGVGSPKKVIHEKSGELRRLRADLQKIERRLADSLRLADLRIKRVIIDGNNASYRGGEFIRLMAVTRIVDNLAMDYEVTVVFDASIRRMLQMDDTMIRSVIGAAAQTFIAPTKTAADQFALELANDQAETFVLSNDRFAEFADFAAVTEKRLIRFLITNEHISIPDLDRTIPMPTSQR